MVPFEDENFFLSLAITITPWRWYQKSETNTNPIITQIFLTSQLLRGIFMGVCLTDYRKCDCLYLRMLFLGPSPSRLTIFILTNTLIYDMVVTFFFAASLKSRLIEIYVYIYNYFYSYIIIFLIEGKNMIYNLKFTILLI